ncbi:MAG: hypothetical protein ACQESR_27710 [Planctomycetota bacterium]
MESSSTQAVLSKVGRCFDKIQVVDGVRPGEIGQAKADTVRRVMFTGFLSRPAIRSAC